MLCLPLRPLLTKPSTQNNPESRWLIAASFIKQTPNPFESNSPTK